MGTSSTISILNNDGTVQSISCNYDGYLSDVGHKLFKHYSNPDKLKQLISMGDLSSLGKEIDIPYGKVHTFEKRLDDVCTFYSRDRGERNVNSQAFSDRKSFLKSSSNFTGYDYIYKEKTATWFLVNTETMKLEKLSTLLLKDKDISKIDKLLIKQQVLSQQMDKHLKANTKMKI